MYFMHDEFFYLKYVSCFEQVDNFCVAIGDKNQEYMAMNLWHFEIWLNDTCSFSFLILMIFQILFLTIFFFLFAKIYHYFNS